MTTHKHHIVWKRFFFFFLTITILAFILAFVWHERSVASLKLENAELKENLNNVQEELDKTKSTIEELEKKLEAKKSGNPVSHVLASIKDKNPEKSYAYDTKTIREFTEKKDYKGEKIAFLTFDDGPNKATTGKILDILKEKDVPATFYMPGKNIGDGTADLLKRIYEEGHVVGSHSFDHNYDHLYPNRIANKDEIIRQENQTLDAFRKYLGSDFKHKTSRYPGGHMSWNKQSLAKSDKALEDMGIIWIDWNTMNGDAQPIKPRDPNDIPRPQNTQQVINNFEHSKRFTFNPNIAVVLMHDGKDVTLNALGSLIDHMRAQGYSFGVLD